MERILRSIDRSRLIVTSGILSAVLCIVAFILAYA